LSSHSNLSAVRSFVAQTAVFALLTCSIAVSVIAQDPDAAIKERIATYENLWGTALKARDLKAIDSILDTSVLLINDDGSIQTKGDFLSTTKQGFSQPRALQTQITLESLTVKLFGTTAVAVGVMRIKGIENGKPFLRRDRFIDTWKYKEGAWKIVGTEATPILR
jgi:ketosteroid isomerase-like protein